MYQTVLTNNIGNIYYFTFNYEKAITYYFESLKYAEKIEDKFYIVSAYNNIGLIYKQLEKYDEAILNIRNAAPLCFTQQFIQVYQDQQFFVSANNAIDITG